MKRLLLLTLALLSLCSLASAQIPAALGWYEVPNTMIRPICWGEDGGLPDPPYEADCRNVVVAWSGGIYDTLRERMVVWGGGHGDYAGNELYAVTFSGTPTVARITDNTNPGACSQPSCDGGITPNARHTYDLLTYAANIDALVSFGGALSGTGFAQADLWLYHFATQTWERRFYTGTTPVSGVAPIGYDSVTNYIYIWDNRSLYRYNPATNVMTAVFFSENGYLSGNTSGVIDPVRRKFWIVTGTSQLGRIDISEGGGDVRSAVTPTGDTTWMAGGMVGIAYDPGSQDLVIWAGGDTVYRYDPDTNVSTAVTGYTGGPGADQDRGTYGRWDYSAALGVFTLINDVGQNAFTFRLGASVPDVEAPTAPSNVSATATSPSQIDLDWDASTDNIGVTGYLIERCTGSGCSNFAQINTTTLTAFSNTGLSASTLYRYRVRATDAAGNFSSYSSIVEDTTDAVDVTAPTDPSMLSAATQSASQINLTWTASTDAVGVTGYRAERCTGASCANFVQVAAPASNSYNDTGLTQNTLYRYRVRATDAAGNLSGYSNIAENTTTAATIRITGTGQTYPTITAAVAAAVDGDIIECDAGTYPNESFSVTQNNLTIRGVGGLCHLRWDTGNYQTSTTQIPNGQAIIKALGANLTFEYLEFSGATVTDNNGAGIRWNGGNLTVRNSYFHDNEQGILGQASPGGGGTLLLVEFSRFENNGQCVAGDCAHNIYIGYFNGEFIFRHNTSLNPLDGHAVKTRAAINYILYNHISTKSSNGSAEIEFSNGHTAYVIGNVIEQGDASDNSAIIRYGPEGLTTPDVDVTHELYVVNNTLYNWRGAGVVYVQVTGTPALCTIVNNARSSTATFISGSCTSLTDSNNVVLPDADWVNVNASDFHIVTGSSAKDAGISPGTGSNGFGLTPLYHYVATASRSARSTVNGTIDIGAYEFGTASPPAPQGNGPGSRRRLRK